VFGAVWRVMYQSAVNDLKLLLAFVNKQHLVSIFFDLEKAYDTS
jgi:hypothetical protein